MHVSYYTNEPTEGLGINCLSRESNEYPIVVNCAGNFVTEIPFVTDNVSGREDFYLMYIDTGTVIFDMPDGKCSASTGNIIIFPPRYGYRYVFSGDSQLSYYWVHFTGSYAKRFLDECGFSELPLISDAGENNRIISRFYRIFEIYESRGSFFRQELACALERLVISAANSVVVRKKRSFECSVKHIGAYYNTDLRVPELAKMENLSNSRYVSHFTEQFGLSPMAYIVRLRLNSACDLLENTDMSVKQIALLVGYEDPRFFSKLFKKHIGLSPVDFRKR